MRIVRTTLVLALLGLLAGCGSQGDTDGGLRPAASRPSTYVVTGVTVKGERRDLVPGTEIRLRLEDGRLTLTAGCNTMSGRYRLDGSRMTVGALQMTEMGCDRARMDQDTWVGGLFARPVQFTPGPDGAVISGETVLALADREQVAPDKPLVGTKWRLDTDYPRGFPVSVPDRISAWIHFDRHGRFRFDDGCNEGGGRASVHGDRITARMVAVTLVLCRGPNLPDFYGVLSGTSTYAIEGRSLTITAGGHKLRFHAVSWLPRH